MSEAAMVRLTVRGDEMGAVRAAIADGAGMLLADADAVADAIVIAGATPDAALALAREALPAGKPVLCLTLPADQAALDRLAGEAARHGAALSLPNRLRDLPAAVGLRDALARGDAGALFSLFASWHTTRALADPLATLGPALLDLLAWCLPSPLARAQVTAGPLFGADRGVAVLTLRGADGLVRTVELASSLPAGHEAEDELLIEVLGEDAALRVEPLNQAITIVGAAGRARRDWAVDPLGPILARFVGALRAGQAPPDPPAALRPIYALVEELRVAATDGEARDLAAD